MPESRRDSKEVLQSLQESLTQDLLTEAYSAAEIDDALRSLGADPDAIGRRGVAAVTELLNARGLGAKEAADEILPRPTQAPVAWAREIHSFTSQVRSKGENRKFEFTQMLRAYRSGIISSSLFESAMYDLATNASLVDASIQVSGRGYASEREAIVRFLETVTPAEAAGEEAMRGWLRVCQLDSIKGGLKMVAERESYHARAFAQRLAELGGSPSRGLSKEMRENIELLSDPAISDLEKLEHVAKQFPDPEEAIRPLFEFADCLKEDLLTKEMVKLFAQDELSSLKWQSGLCAELTALHSYGPLGVRA